MEFSGGQARQDQEARASNRLGEISGSDQREQNELKPQWAGQVETGEDTHRYGADPEKYDVKAARCDDFPKEQ